MTDDKDLRAAAVGVCRLWFTDNAPCDSQHVRKAMLELREAVDALAASATDEGPDIETQCYRCGGDGWFIDADPLPSGEPGEPYQVQCGDCGGTGVIYQPAARPAVPALDEGPRDLTEAEIERLAEALRRADHKNWSAAEVADYIAGTVASIARPAVPALDVGPQAGFTVERWIDSLHENVNGTVWTTKAELRAALAASATDGWKEEARQQYENVRYWRERAETCEALAVGAPVQDLRP